MAKNTFMVYKDWYDMIAELETEDKASLLDAMFIYQTTGSAPQMTTGARIIFARIKKMFDKDGEAYEKVCKTRSEQGKKGGLAKASKRKQLVSKGKQVLPDNDNVYISKDIYREKIIPLINQYSIQGYKKEDLEEQSELCRLHHLEKKGGIQVAVTTFDRRLKNAIERGQLTKPKKQMQLANDLYANNA